MKKKRRNKKRKELKQLGELVSYGDFVLPPVVPGPEVEDLCEKIDDFYKDYPKQHRKQKASDLIKGAFYAARSECKSNDDWMSQAANSLRGVLYPLFSNQVSKNNLLKLFRKYATDKQYRTKTQNSEFITTFNTLDKIYKQLSDLAHHGTELKGFSDKQYSNFSRSDFGNLLGDFVSILRKAFVLQQIYIHTIIDLIVQRKRRTKALKQDLELVLKVNPDARQYFFTKADERWLGWLWQNGFLDVIKQKAKDPTRYSYRTPEINYLVRMAEKNPAKVVDIMLAVKISETTFNPEVVDRFLQICSSLPANQLVRVAGKIRDERWIPLMGVFNQWGFEYEKIFKTLAEAKDYKNILAIAEAILSVRSKEEIEKSPRRGFDDNPFYFNDLSYTKVFEYLANIGNDYAHEALALTTKVITQIIGLWNKEEEGPDERVFAVYDKFLLLDVDFFSLEQDQRKHLSPREDIRELAALIKVLTQRLIGDKCAQPKFVQEVYQKYIQPLPDSRSMWRLRMFVLSLCPTAFKKELKDSFFRLFTVKRYYNEIISGTEYLKALRAGFSVLADDDQKDYVKRVIEYFQKKDQEKENEKEDWHLRYGSRILSVIADELNDEGKKAATKSGFTIQPEYEPEPSIGEMRGGTVVPRGPISQEEFGQIAVTEITRKLRNEWTPEKLSKQSTSDDFLNPLNAEGAGQLLRNDITKRLQEYVDNAVSFFDRDTLDTHYTYSFLRGIEETLKNNKHLASQINWGGVIDLLSAIKESGEKKSFPNQRGDHDSFDAWLSSWTSVHSVATDVIQELLREQNDPAVIDFAKYRDRLFGIIKYLLNYPDPTPKDEQIDTAGMKTKTPGADYKVSDPFTMAINSVRGRAFQAFVLFVYPDGKKFKKEDKVKVSEDVKELYKNVLEKENTRALMFMFGHYLPTFYFRDKDLLKGLFPQIFPQKQEHLYSAAWEGYLTTNLYEEIFFEPEIQKLYEYGITLKNDEDLQQEHFRQLDEGIATHLALAYTHYEKFDFNHPLLKIFWKKGSQDHHAHFVSFIGRSLITSDNNRFTEAEKRGIKIKERIGELWDWMLEHYTETKPFEEFGFWVNLEKDIFEPAWLAERLSKTLEKTKGVLTWDYALSKSIVMLAEQAPQDTLKIANQCLLEGGVRGGAHRRPLLLDSEWFDALKILYANMETKSGTYSLINNLIREGGSTFWKLKDITEDSS